MNFKRKRGKNTGQSKQRQRREKEMFKTKDRRAIRRVCNTALQSYRKTLDDLEWDALRGLKPVEAMRI